MEKQGYLIVLKPEVNISDFDVNLKKEHLNFLKEYRKPFANFDIEKYRGISREPLNSFIFESKEEVERFAQAGINVNANKEAKIRLDKSIPERDKTKLTRSFFFATLLRSFCANSDQKLKETK